MVPVEIMRNEGFQITYANPLGNTPSLDPFSDHSIWFGFSKDSYSQAKERLEKEKIDGLNSPLKFSEISDEKLESFDAVFIPGGHAPMEDLWKDKDLGRILLHFHNKEKVTGAICHGPIGLLSTKLVQPEGEWCYYDYQMTAYSDWEEYLNQLLWLSRLKLKVEDALCEAGARMNENWPLLPNVVVHKELITGQGPTSVWRFGRKFVDEIKFRGIQSQ